MCKQLLNTSSSRAGTVCRMWYCPPRVCTSAVRDTFASPFPWRTRRDNLQIGKGTKALGQTARKRTIELRKRLARPPFYGYSAGMCYRYPKHSCTFIVSDCGKPARCVPCTFHHPLVSMFFFSSVSLFSKADNDGSTWPEAIGYTVVSVAAVFRFRLALVWKRSPGGKRFSSVLLYTGLSLVFEKQVWDPFWLSAAVMRLPLSG